jgi:hypothetical protein
MSTTNLTTFQLSVNLEERRLIDKVRRIARRHSLRLAKSRVQEFSFDEVPVGYSLQSFRVIAHGLKIQDALSICKQLDGERTIERRN